MRATSHQDLEGDRSVESGPRGSAVVLRKATPLAEGEEGKHSSYTDNYVNDP